MPDFGPGFISMRPGHWLALAAVVGAVVVSVLLGPLVARHLPSVGWSDAELQRDVCVREYHNNLGPVDVTGSISVGEFMGRPPTGDDVLYRAEIEKLAAAHGASPNGASYGLKSSYRSDSTPGAGTALAIIWEAGNAKAGRFREYTLFRSVVPERAARIVFEDIVKESTGYRSCRDGRRQRSVLPGAGSQLP